MGTRKKTILFLCTGNSCRSRMAEGWAKKYLKDTFNVYSAGIEKHGLNPSAVKVMQEAGVEEALGQYRSVRDEIKVFVLDFSQLLESIH